MRPEPPYDSPKKTKFQLFAEQRLEATKIARSAMKTVKDISKKPGLAPESTIQNRRDICAVCEYFDDKRNRCKKCGCMLRAKTAFLGAKCPISKW
jgi:hypothetical protein